MGVRWLIAEAWLLGGIILIGIGQALWSMVS